MELSTDETRRLAHLYFWAENEQILSGRAGSELGVAGDRLLAVSVPAHMVKLIHAVLDGLRIAKPVYTNVFGDGCIKPIQSPSE